MAGPYRLDEKIVAQAEASAAVQKRSVPRQIEFWAEIGRRVEARLDHAGLMALMQDRAVVEVKPLPSEPVDADEVFASVERDRAAGSLSGKVTTARVIYEASPAHPGFLDRIDEDGSRVTGYFDGGEFVPGMTRRKSRTAAPAG